MGKMLRGFWNDESGQGLVEYALILFLVALAVILALRLLGTNTEKIVNNVAQQLT